MKRHGVKRNGKSSHGNGQIYTGLNDGVTMGKRCVHLTRRKRKGRIEYLANREVGDIEQDRAFPGWECWLNKYTVYRNEQVDCIFWVQGGRLK